MKHKIAVFGNQHMNLGHVIAADLTLAGYEVALLDLPEYQHETLEPVRAQGGIYLTGNPDNLVSGQTGLAKIDTVTTDSAVLEDADVLFVDVPADEFEIRLKPIAPYIKDGAILHFNYFGYWPSLRVATILKEAGKEDVAITECPTALYYSQSKNGELEITSIKQGIPLSVFPARKTAEVFDVFGSVYPNFVPAKNILETNFMNLNMTAHASIALLNMGYLDRAEAVGKPAHFYSKGITKHICILALAQDREREAVCQAYGVSYIPLDELEEKFVGSASTHLAEAPNNLPMDQSGISYPVDMCMKWILWDMPFAFVPFVSLAELAGISMPIHRGLIELFGATLETDFWDTGLTLDKLGLSGLSPEQISQYVTVGGG